MLLLLSLTAIPVTAAVSGRANNIKSRGVFVGTNGSREVVLDSADLRYLADQIDVLDRTIQGLTLQSNASISYTYHTHRKGDGVLSSVTLYQAFNPGGCYVSGGHTHNATGTCGTTTETTTVTEKCDGSVHGASDPDGSVYDECSSCGKRWTRGTGPSTCYKIVTKTKTSTVYACGSPTNTWVIGCGKTSNSIDSAYIVFN